MPATMLRPLSLGELLDRTFSLYKSNFLLFFGVMVWPSLLAVGISLLNLTFQTIVQTHKSSGAVVAMGLGAVGGTLLLMLAYWIAYTIALGATTFAVSDVYLGETATIAGSYRKMRGHIWRLLRLLGFIGLQVFAVIFAFGILAAIFAAIGQVLGGVAIVILSPLLFGLPIWILLRNSVAVPALIVENLNAGPAAERSVKLTKGNLGRALLVILLTTMITYIVLGVFEGPFFVAAIMASTHGQPSVWLMGIGSVMGALGGALAAPLIMIGLVLLYYDIRVRKEAFDLQLLMGPPVENAGGDSPAAAAAPSV